MTDAVDGGLLVCELHRRGKLAVGEPFFTPGRPLTLGRRSAVDAAEGDLVAVDADAGGRARLVEVLGRPDDPAAVLYGVAVEAGVATPWPAEVEDALDELPRDPLDAPPDRADLRHLLTFTIDPPTARDFDDALSVEMVDGAVRIWVHIADVAAFVPAGGAIDTEAARRATSVYLPGRVEPMLPELLSAGLCSLQPERDRYAVTVELTARPVAFQRTLIRSDHRLSYPQVERILDGAERAAPDLLEALSVVRSTAGSMREERRLRGALTVDAGEVEFDLDGHRPVAARMAAEPEAHALIEELMLAANSAVAEVLVAARRPALFRVHEPPTADAIEALVARLAALDVPTPPMPDLHTPRQAAEYAAAVAAGVLAYVRSSGRGRYAFPGLVLRALQRARYDPANLGHSALVAPAYCHFTSPIRRYPDLVCHRALLAELGVGPETAGDKEELAALAVWTSAAERSAELLERHGTDVAVAFLLERELYERGWDTEFPGEVVGLIGGGAFVRFGDVYEGLVPLRLLGEERYDLDEIGVALVGRRSGHRLRLGDPLTVRVRRVERAIGRVQLEAD